MYQPLLNRLLLGGLWFCFSSLLVSQLAAATFYVAPTGRDTNPGTPDLPFATVQRAQAAVAPGDTVYFRGGTYVLQESQIARQYKAWAYVHYLDKSGTADQPIRYWAAPGERPVFDLSAVKPQLRIDAFYVAGSWIHLKGLEVIGVQVTQRAHTQSICFENAGNHNLFEALSMHDGQAIGYYSVRGAKNLVLNCDAYNNYDFTSENGAGGNVDGFGCHPRKGDTGNVFRGCRAWFNSDDGYDCINAHEAVTFEHCGAFYNGYSPQFESRADGNGFKAGGYGSTPADRLPPVIPRHTVRFCLAVRNKASGFYANHHPGGGDWFNNSAYRNGTNFNLLCRLADNVTDVPGFGHKLRNNLGYKARTELAKYDATKCDSSHNSWDLRLQLTDQDFVSLDETELIRPRAASGELPAIGFFRPAAGSSARHAGTPIGFPFPGPAPNLGAFQQ